MCLPWLAFLTHPGAVLLSDEVAARYGLKAGSSFTLVVDGKPKTVYVAGLLQPDNSLTARTLDGLVLADISTAQELTGMTSTLSRIDLILPKDDPAAAQRLSAWLPPGSRIEESAARSGTLEQMTSAFQLNLSALSLLALVVGLFLIYNTMTFSVVQRRALFGTLRCLGVTRREVFALVLSEAFAVGLLGGLLGIALGILLGQVTVRMVTQTVNDLYFTTTVQPSGIDLISLLKGAGLGLLAAVITAALPAWEAASIPPRSALLRSGLEAKTRAGVGRTVLAGILLGLAGLACFAIPSSSLILGFTGTLLVVVGAAFLSSAALVLLMNIIAPISARLFGFIGRMAPRSLIHSLSRTAVAVAALMVAVAVIIGVALMIDSFRYTVVLWLGQTLQGDVYVTVPSFNATQTSAVINSSVVDQIRAWPGVARVDVLRAVTVDARLPSGAGTGPVSLSATDNARTPYERLFARQWISPDQMWAALRAGSVLISEPLANRLGIPRRAGRWSFTPRRAGAPFRWWGFTTIIRPARVGW